MKNVNQLIHYWRRGQRSYIIQAYQNHPQIFDDAPKGPHPIQHLYRSMLMEYHILGDLWDHGKKEISPFLKLEVWYNEARYCITPHPITKYIFEVTFKKIVPWTERIVSLGDGSIVCKEQLLTPEDVYWIENGNKASLHGEKLQLFLQEFRRRKES